MATSASPASPSLPLQILGVLGQLLSPGRSVALVPLPHAFLSLGPLYPGLLLQWAGR